MPKRPRRRREPEPLDDLLARMRDASCTGKVRHATEADAARVAGEDILDPKGWYRCAHCGGWHVGGARKGPQG